jgi:Tfp pilus assembly protein PilW
MIKNFAQDIHIVPVYFGADKASGVIADFINMKLFHKVEFILGFGTQGTADYEFQVVASAAQAGSSGSDIDFKYRKTAAAGTDTMGDVTAVTAGSTVTAAYATDSTMYWVIDVDSSDLTDAKPYVGIELTRGSSATAQIQLIALCWPRYPKETNSGALT